MGEIKTRSQSIDFLGFLRSQLSGLQGIPTLCYELIQNADDVKNEQGISGAKKITFDVCNDALLVENDGVFRGIDFDRMERVSWGNKREEENTTGAFGIGFISVYQITDSPEIFSSGQHWQFQPQAPENQRILVREEDTQFTKFRLPWAYEMSQIRKEMGIPPVERDQLDSFTHQLIAAIGSAALFLKQVRMLEVKRSGELIRRIEVLKEGDWLLLDTGDQTVKWRILEGNFNLDATIMRNKYGQLIEEKRRSLVQLAIPEKPMNGLLYAFLPSETRTGLPFHINADFYPSSDRKRILLENDYKSEWNRLAIMCAAETLGSHLEQVLEIFPRQVFWDFAGYVKRATDTNMAYPVFTNFWEKLKSPIREKPTVLTDSGKELTPPQTVFLDTDEQIQSANIFEELGINTIHPDLRSYRNLLIETGARLLKLPDISDAFKANGLTKRTELVNMPASLDSKSGWIIFWSALDDLWKRASIQEKLNAGPSLKNCAIAFGSDGALWPLVQMYQADAHTRGLFSKFSQVVWFDQQDEALTIPGNLVPQFGLTEGVETLKEVQDKLPSAWATRAFSPQEIYDWLEGHRAIIAANPQIQHNIRSLAIWPSAEGKLQPLDSLFLAGDFEDPLHLAQLIDVEVLGGRKELLERVLSVNKLDFVTYVQYWMPTAFKSRQLDQEKRFHLLRVLGENLGKLQGQIQLQEILSNLPLVWCGDDVFGPAGNVYFDSKDVEAVLGEETPIAQLPSKQPDAIYAFYDWLGVAKSPRPKDIIARVRALVASPPDDQKIQTIEAIFNHLASQWHQWGDEIRKEYSPLQKEAWLPGSKNSNQWFDASSVYTVFREYLFESQGNFLKIDLHIQQKERELIRFLGIQGEPSTEQVVKHLLYASENDQPVTQEIYVYLAQNAGDPAIHQLREKACLYLKTSTDIEKYFRPDQVYWDQHPFGHYRIRLSPDFGRFKNLFDELGVKETPDAEDAIAVLKEISEEYGKSNTPLEEGIEIEHIIVMCWKLLSIGLEKNQIKTTGIKHALGKIKTIPDSRHILEPPNTLFFDDRLGWGQKFELIKNNLVRPVEGAWLAMEAAGVQRLSNAVTIDVHRKDNPQKDDKMAEYLSERIPLIRRVIEAHRSKGISGFELEKIEDLSYSKVDSIEIVRVFNGFGRQERSPLEIVDAIHIDGELYFCSENGSLPWKSIARELAYVLHPSGELSSLGMELKEILSQTVLEANITLDEYGYPRVDQAPAQIPNSPIAKPGTEPKSSEQEPIDQSEEPSQGEQKGSKPSDGSSRKSTKKPKIETRKKSRLISYVCPPDEDGNGKQSKPEDPELAAHRTKIAEIGVAHAMKYEIEHGRTPTDMETIQVNHPGYDIKSMDEMDQARYIEVKSFSGIWDSQNPAQMTRTEFEHARMLGESYWLYVVENVEEEDYKIYTICNPANRADYYLFDHGWQPLSISS